MSGDVNEHRSAFSTENDNRHPGRGVAVAGWLAVGSGVAMEVADVPAERMFGALVFIIGGAALISARKLNR